jgi:hypothetical protein
MDPRIDIWNALHDGEITVSAVADGVLTMFVNIPYLRARLEPLGDSFVVRLLGLRSFALSNLDGKVESTNPADLSQGGYEIPTESEGLPVIVQLTMGSMALDFQSLEIALDTGRVLPYQELWQASKNYWDEWEAKGR